MQRGFAKEVRRGLTGSPKSLPPWLFYDAVGTQLFERITGLPEYYPTRTELLILQEMGPQMVRQAGVPPTVVELGVGSAYKTRVLIEALLELRARATFIPVDVSGEALKLAQQRLEPIFPRLEIHPLRAEYQAALEQIRATAGPKLVLFIGSSIGNFEPDEALAFLCLVRRALTPGSTLLLGTDLRKPRALLEAAYNDAAGVTAAFNLHLLERINRELGGHFALERFRHAAHFDDEHCRIQMHLQSVQSQQVDIDGLGLRISFEPGERIHTENSYKFTVGGAQALLARAGFENLCSWTDPRGWFGVHLARVT
ncbi:MAG: methyltransferase [Myxococcaceae bacterium]|nr:methyltransferase [Myxococcaceae bacterium]